MNFTCFAAHIVISFSIRFLSKINTNSLHFKLIQSMKTNNKFIHDDVASSNFHVVKLINI